MTPWHRTLADHGLPPLVRAAAQTLQINVGKRCNQTCRHCHVDAGPRRTESMTRDTAARLVWLLKQNPSLQIVDITGGAPELNENFRDLVRAAKGVQRHVIDRCNLTVLQEPGQEDTASFLADHDVEIVASLPCYSRDNVEKQRGEGVFSRSIEALQELNSLGYGQPDTGLLLNLVYNPLGASLPPSQESLEAAYKARLSEDFGIVFNHLYTVTNMPISRFARDLARQGKQQEYMDLLVQSFNPAATPHLMCRTQLSVGWDGSLYDCDFNQMLEIPLGSHPQTVWDIDSVDSLAGQAIAVGAHCLGCTAGAGSSCGGAVV